MRHLAIHRALPLLLVSLGLSSTASAQAPMLLPVQGYLTAPATGAPLDGEFNVRFRLYPDPEAAMPHLFEEDVSVTVTDGYFVVYLGDTASLNLGIFRDNSVVFLGTRIGNDPEGRPLVQLATAPFAAFAQHCGEAATIGGATRAEMQSYSNLNDVPASFPPSAHTHTLAQVTGAQARVSDACTVGSSIRAIAADGTVTCQADTNTTYSAGAGLNLSTTTFSTSFGGTGSATTVARSDHTHTSFGATVTATGFNYSSPRTVVHSIPAHAFSWTGGTGLDYGGSSVRATQNGVLANVFAPVQLPEGATPTRARCHYRDADTNAGRNFSSVWATLIRTAKTGTASGTTVTVGTASTTDATTTNVLTVETTSLSTVSPIANNTYYYRIGALIGTSGGSWSSSGLHFYGCDIQYTLTSPSN